MGRIARALATGLSIGYVPLAPGTAGSLLAVFIYALLPRSQTFLGWLALTAVTFGVGVWAATRVEKDSGVRDNPIIVIDEIAGVFVTFSGIEKDWLLLALGFILFRLFDIMKPFPVSRGERLPGGWGIMLDDVIAGIYAAASLRLIHFVIDTL